MKKKNPIKTVYYKDELNDEFSSAVITPKKIDGDYFNVVGLPVSELNRILKKEYSYE